MLCLLLETAQALTTEPCRRGSPLQATYEPTGVFAILEHREPDVWAAVKELN